MSAWATSACGVRGQQGRVDARVALGPTCRARRCRRARAARPTRAARSSACVVRSRHDLGADDAAAEHCHAHRAYGTVPRGAPPLVGHDAGPGYGCPVRRRAPVHGPFTGRERSPASQPTSSASRSSSVSRRTSTARRPVAHRDDGRARHAGCSSRPSSARTRRWPARRAGRRRRTSPGRCDVVHDDVAALAVLADDTREPDRLAAESARRARVYSAPYRAGRMLSLMPPSTETYRARAAVVERDGLDRPDRVERQPRRARDRAARLDREPRQRRAEPRRTPRRRRATRPWRSRPASSGDLAGQVGDAVAATEVDLGHLAHRCAAASSRPQREHRACRDLEPRRVEDLAADVRVDARASSSVPACASTRERPASRRATRRGTGRTSGPRARSRCTRGRRRARRWSTRTMTGAGSARGAPRGRASARGRSPSRESTTIRADARLQRAGDLRVGLVVAVQGDVGSGARRPRRASASSPPVATSMPQALLVHPRGRRASTGTPCPRSRRRPRCRSAANAAPKRRAEVPRPWRGSRPRPPRTTGVPCSRGERAHVAAADRKRTVLAARSPRRTTAGESDRQRSHPLRRADAQQPQTVGEDLAGGVVEPQAGAVRRP